MLGTCIGLAYHPSEGMCDVYQMLDTTQLVALVSRKTGNRRFMRRELVQWRTHVATTTQQPGPTTQARTERASQRSVVRDVTLFEME